jgi:hypothetical protein
MALLCTARPAMATTLARLDLGQLTAQAAAVVRARCFAVEVRAEAGGRWTLTTFQRTQLWKGEVPLRFVVRLPGGASGGLRETVEGVPQFTAGEEAVLFLEPLRAGNWTIVGWAQGTYRIRSDARSGVERAAPDAEGMLLLDPRSGAFHASRGHVLSVGDLRAAVARLEAGGGR